MLADRTQEDDKQTILACNQIRIFEVREDTVCLAGNAISAAATGVKRSAGNRHRFGSAMDSYSIRFASGRISPNLDPQVGDCWLDTTGELRRVQRPGRHKARDALPMPRDRRALRNGRPRPPRQTVLKAPPRLPGECCRPNRWRHGDRLALAAQRTTFQTSPQHSGTTRERSDALAWRRMTARGTLSSWSNLTAGDVNGLFLTRVKLAC